MLLNVHVKDLALIEDADICFGEGLNILTGETGAGKSIIIGSIGLALGEKAGRDIVRQGAAFGLVELVFSVDSKKTIEQLKNLDVAVDEDEQIIITRRIMNGKSLIKINGETKTVSTLKKVTSLLIDVHGQHDYESLLHVEKHLEILDSFGGDDVYALRAEVSALYKEFCCLKKEIDDFTKDEEIRSRDLAFFEFEAEQIRQADLKIDEDKSLEDEYKLMSNSRKIASIFSDIHQLISCGDDSASDKIGTALKEISSINHLDIQITNIYDSICTVDALCTELSNDIAAYLSKIDFDEERISYVSDRLDTINRLKLKHGKTIDAILDKLNDLDKKIDDLTNFDETKSKLEAKLSDLENILLQKSNTLSGLRKKAAKDLEKHIIKALKDLNFLEVSFEVLVTTNDTFSSKGLDSIEFMISTNPGETLRPLAKIASGGELSRIMLGLKAVLAKKDAVDTLIFDEIDTGISGKTAGMVADKMSTISSEHQVICITHLPQIASHADRHYLIEKEVRDNHTFTNIKQLDYDKSVSEIARMLGGTTITDAAITNARELKKMAGKL